MPKSPSGGILAALVSALFLGTAPIFGKLAIEGGFSPLLTVALRTGLATLALLILVSVFFRRFLYIHPLGLAGCGLAGTINGAGSILYYLALGRLDAGFGQLLYSLYPFFVAFWLFLDHQPPSRLTMTRVAVATVAVIMLTSVPGANVDLPGVFLMLGAAVLYAMHLPINQRVLYEVPAPTVTLYTLLAMSAVVFPAYLIFDRSWPGASAAWLPILGLSAVTFSSRLLLFLGIKRIGGMQTALLGLAELIVTLLLSRVWLGERLATLQWVGALALTASLLLVYLEKTSRPSMPNSTGWLAWLRNQDLGKALFGPFE